MKRTVTRNLTNKLGATINQTIMSALFSRQLSVITRVFCGQLMPIRQSRHQLSLVAVRLPNS